MKIGALLGASALIIAAASAAHAAPINYSNFTGATGLDYAGSGADTGATVTLDTVSSTTSAGAVYAANAIASPLNFSTTFSFNITSESNGLAGNGFVFVLTTAPGTLGTSNNNLGLGAYSTQNPTPSLDIQFSTFANKNNNPTYSPTGCGTGGTSACYYSNLVAVTTNGNTAISQSATNTYAAPYGVDACDNTSANKSSHAGCMSNGDIWTASIKYQNGLLTVTVSDPKEGTAFTIINGLAISLSSIFGSAPVYAGFASSNGAASETVQLDSWVLTSVPEPLSLAAFGAGLAGLAMVRRRRAA